MIITMPTFVLYNVITQVLAEIILLKRLGFLFAALKIRTTMLSIVCKPQLSKVYNWKRLGEVYNFVVL